MSVFEGKVTVITGGASGIGRAVAEEMARKGARLVLADIDGDKAAQVAAGITEQGGSARALAVDVSDFDQVQALVDGTFDADGRLDYLFNNAGIALFGEVRDMTLEQWQRLLHVNMHGVVHGVHAAYPRMVEQGSGHIVNTASLAGLNPSPLATAYAMTKHGVVGMSTSLRGEGAALGVKVSAVCPGVIDTPLKDALTYVKLDKERMLGDPLIKLYPVEKCARVILRGVERNRAIIPVTTFAHGSWLLFRLFPQLVASTMGARLMQLARDRFQTPR